jgi:5-methylcytosine-specific restriction enzyme subunit McrC
LAADLAAAARLTVLEMRDGLQVETTSYVGTVQLGGLHLTIQPKLQGLPLVNLLRYTYGLRDLKLFEALPQGVTGVAFQDLLIHQLAAEVSELLARGLHRRYERVDALLASPRGRIAFTALAQQMGAARAALPCSHHPRQEDTLHNRAILAGLHLGTRLAGDLALRGRLRRLASQLADSVTATPLTTDLLRHVRRQSDRLTAAYRPGLAIIDLLMAGQGTALRAGDRTVAVPGFLFDMNRFFQALISRFLHEHLPGYFVHDERRLHGMLAYEAQRNPRGRHAPAPRPDFVLLQGVHIVAMLDAKYRDLWEQPLPREMLYQLVIYATSGGAGGRSTILYPTLNANSQDQCIEVRDPVADGRRAEVILRPVDMLRLEQLVAGPSGAREADAYARRLVLGDN